MFASGEAEDLTDSALKKSRQEQRREKEGGQPRMTWDEARHAAEDGWKRTGFIVLFPWTISIDQVVWTLNW